MEAVEKYFSDKGKVAIWDAPIEIERLTHPITKLVNYSNGEIVKAFFKKLTETLIPLGKRVLDAGCNVGWFTFMLEEAGAFVTGVESDLIMARTAEGIRQMKGYRCEIVPMDINRYLETHDTQFDAVLLLNVFDQMLRADEATAWRNLNTMRTRSKQVYLMAGATEQLPNMAGLRTEHPKWVPLQPPLHSWEMGHEMILRKGGFSGYKQLLRDSYFMRDLWLFY